MTSHIPYTSAASDFLKLVLFKDNDKSNLIDYAATDFLSLRAALINYIKAVYPLDYNLFSESDLGMMFIEMVAYMGSVLSMKADMLAHESFLKTAKNPTNIRKLLQLIGVKFRGPSAAAGQPLITLEGAEIPPGESIIIPVASRVFSRNSDVDGATTNYVLYKVQNGKIMDINATNTIELTYSESDSENGLTWSNLVLVEGTLVVDTNTFSDVDVIKEVTLANSPVIDGSVEVFIDTGDPLTSQPYTEVQSLLSTSSSDQRAFEVTYNPDFTAKVIFGDGVTANLPPVGSTYTINYRAGGGIRGNASTGVIDESVAIAGERSINVKNTLPFTGGLDSESIEHVKKYAQLTFKQQDRLVSLDDYTSFSNTFKSSTGASGKAIAVTRKAYSSANIIDVYIVEIASDTQLQKASLAYKSNLLEAMGPKKMMTDELVVVDGLIRTVDLVVEVTLDARFKNKESAIKASTSRVILDYFNVSNREFGESFFPQDIAREIFTAIPEVRLAEITNYKDPITLEFNEILQLNNFKLVLNYV
jgi:hypothetical protein